MPKFNKENPVNASGSALESPEEFLFRTVREIIMAEGRGALKPEYLLAKGCDRELLAKYEEPGDLLEDLVNDMIESLESAYEYVNQLAWEYLESDNQNRDRSIAELERMIGRHFYICLNPKNKSYVVLFTQENLFPERFREKLAKALQKNVLTILTELIVAASEVKNREKASILAYQVIGNINLIILQPELVKASANYVTGYDPNFSNIEDYTNNMLLRSIWWNTSMNKMF